VPHVVTLGDQTIELTYVGPSHGAGMIVMRVPKERVLNVVDICTPQRIVFRNFPDTSPQDLARLSILLALLFSLDRGLPPTPLIALSSAFFSGDAQNVGSPTLNFRCFFAIFLDFHRTNFSKFCRTLHNFHPVTFAIFTIANRSAPSAEPLNGRQAVLRGCIGDAKSG
jgi:hypothetical protein